MSGHIRLHGLLQHRVRAFLILVLSYVLFLIFGAVVFAVLEQPDGMSLLAEVQDLREEFLDSNRCVQEGSLRRLLAKALFADKRGVAVLGADSEELSYDFTSSLFFVTAFLTTTVIHFSTFSVLPEVHIVSHPNAGYGSTMPMSDEGKLFCVLYCLLGIPLTLLLMSSLTRCLLQFTTHRPVRHIQTHWGLSHSRAALAHAAVLVTGTAVLFFLLPAAGLCLLEQNWTFLDSLYVCFISISTIGLGDYVPGRTSNQAAPQGLEFAFSCYILLGLVVLLLVLETIWELPQIRGLIRLVSGLREGQLMGLAMDELDLGEDHRPQSSAEELQYSLPISTISSISHLSLCISEEHGATNTKSLSSCP
ncbi:potassium channel subfamily K member 1-like [Scleropages formosus]|uniref:Potassium channel subfamily K member 1-like n=1 Tax=Scleropages formosus TaxID=113540 RepID=A0A0P7V060_SCLFO|nr:potassium channel subfamily K member 1-like [Scleropages formosus]